MSFSQSLDSRTSSAWRTALAALGILVLSAGAVFAETHIVQMTSVEHEPQFVPADLTIQLGDTVEWINVDPTLIDHSTVSGSGTMDPEMGDYWRSGIMMADASYEYRFNEIGDYEYFSDLHEFEGMFGVVRVHDGSSSVDNPRVVESTWSRVKQQFAELIPRD